MRDEKNCVKYSRCMHGSCTKKKLYMNEFYERCVSHIALCFSIHDTFILCPTGSHELDVSLLATGTCQHLVFFSAFLLSIQLPNHNTFFHILFFSFPKTYLQLFVHSLRFLWGMFTTTVTCI